MFFFVCFSVSSAVVVTVATGLARIPEFQSSSRSVLSLNAQRIFHKTEERFSRRFPELIDIPVGFVADHFENGFSLIRPIEKVSFETFHILLGQLFPGVMDVHGLPPF